MQAGIPFDLLTEKDLADINKVSQYETLVFPSFTHVNSILLKAIESNLNDAVYKYGTNLVAAGNFMTNDETGAFIGGNRMQNLLGVTPDFKNIQQIDGLAPNTIVDAVVKAKDINGGILQGYTANEQIYTYQQNSQFSLPVFNSLNGSGTVLAAQEINGKSYNAVITTKTGGNNIHFASEGILANSNLLWQGLQAQSLGSGAKVSLSMTRDASIFMSRDDVDLSKYVNVAPGVQDELTTILSDWKNNYGFVGSHYINIGINDPSSPSYNPASPEGTNWEVMRPIYQKWLELGNEIGTHSYTHPFYTGDLTPEQIKFEFEQSRLEIEKQLGIKVTGAAIPGNPEDFGQTRVDANGNTIINAKHLYVDREIEKYFGTPEVQGYLTGVGAGYTNSFGFLTPDSKIVFFEPNTSFDFNLIEFKKLTSAQAEAVWEKEYHNLTSHANLAMIQLAWHDYAVTETLPGYTRSMFEDFIAHAHKNNTEFVTLDDVQKRIRTFDNSQLFVDRVGDTVTAKIVSNDVGKFALDVNQGKIKSVTNWYAYNDDKVFLPKTGGEFKINLGTVADNVTRIIDLPQRAELLSVLGDGKTIDFSFTGEGKVILNVAGLTSDQKIATTGADNITINGNLVELNFTKNQTHTAKLFFRPDALPIVANPLSNIVVNEDALRTTIDLSQVFTDPDDDIAKIVKSIQTNSNTGLVNAQILGNTLTLDYLKDQFGQADITIRGTSNGKTVDNTFKVNVNSVDDAPTLANTIANITVNQDAVNTTIDLSKVFTDIDNDPNLIVKSVQTNTNPNLLRTSLTGNNLTLDYLQDQFGEADITIRGTSNGKTIDNTFKVTVNDLFAAYNQIQGNNNNNTLFGTNSNNRMYGLDGNDNLFAFGRNNRLFGGAGEDILNGSIGDDYLVGGTGNDRLYGYFGSDVFIGVDPNSLTPGRGEIDIIGDVTNGNMFGSDRYILGDVNNVYYNDGNAATNGTGDYAVISGFARNRDIIQLKGKATDYSLGTASNGGTAIYWKGDGQPELIGIIAQPSNLNLSSSYFSYV
jgi:serralysin